MVQKQAPKQVIIIRKDLKMRKGKIAAMAAHASMKVLLDRGSLFQGEFNLTLNKDLSLWLHGSFTKVCVSVDSEDELLDVHKQALSAGIMCSLIQDEGRTEFNNVPTYTAVAIGPADPDLIDKITGDLKLL